MVGYNDIYSGDFDPLAILEELQIKTQELEHFTMAGLNVGQENAKYYKQVINKLQRLVESHNKNKIHIEELKQDAIALVMRQELMKSTINGQTQDINRLKKQVFEQRLTIETQTKAIETLQQAVATLQEAGEIK